jgi:hypothetical protein
LEDGFRDEVSGYENRKERSTNLRGPEVPIRGRHGLVGVDRSKDGDRDGPLS